MRLRTNECRAVFLTVLLVLSVFAGTVAFSGSVAAAGASTDTGNSSITPATVDEESTNTYTFTLNASNINTSGDGDQIFSVDLPDNFTTDSSAVQATSVNEGSVTFGSDSIDTTTNTINVTLSDNSGVNDDTVNVSFEVTDVGVPDVSGDTTVNAQFGVDYDGDGAIPSGGNDAAYSNFQQITIQDSGVGPQSGSPTLESAIHYDNDPSSSVDSEIELAFSEQMDSSTLSNIQPYVDDAAVPGGDYSIDQADKGRVVIQFTNNELRTGDVVVDVPDSVTDTTGNGVSNSGNETVTFAPSTVKGGNDLSAYRGSNVSVIANSVGSDVTIEGAGDETDSYFAQGSTGPTSKVYVLYTEERNLGTFDIDVEGTSGTANLTLRDLGLTIAADDSSVTTEEDITGTVEARGSGRSLTLELLDNSGDTVDGSTTTASLNGQGEYDFSFDPSSSGLDLDPGNYTVLVTDDYSGVEAESSDVTVSEAGDEAADFASTTVNDQRGDTVAFTVEVDNTDTATVTFGTESQGVVSNVSVEDNNGDDEVTLYLNTYSLWTVGETSGELSQSSSTSLWNVDDESDDEVLSWDLSSNTSDLIDAGDYDLEARPNEGVSGTDSTGIATVVLEERDTQEFRTWTAPEGTTIADLEDVTEAVDNGELTQTSDIANGDIVVHELQSTGLEGALGAQQTEDVSEQFFDNSFYGSVYDLTVEQSEAGANQDAFEVLLNESNTTVLADGGNDTYYVYYDTDVINTTRSDQSIPDDEGLTANFTVFNDNGFDFVSDDLADDEDEETLVDYEVTEPDVTVDEPYNVSQAGDQTISGDTTLAPGTELTLRVRSTGDTSPSFLKTASPVVQSDRTWSATFDFSSQSIGDEYDIVVNGGNADEVSESGEVVEAVDTTTEPVDTTTEPADTTTEPADATTEPADTTTEPADTTTEEPATETPTSTPGFGVVVALTALIAAALLAIRRD
ncbi:BGTF surface domain-containing protein [Halobellus clavatus]|uniref:PGF-CTERM protein/surface glycoprotein n=1 Tax=Halobellus clavatus TaxID=660517 RepID=A0A1H3JT10_9EURY|nr:BGTF surface domain-containing protein [Halobellus clavatus]SDY43120.1 PGF-CTERM protein/surface glycoprotein [Halobellus clavatus]